MTTPRERQFKCGAAKAAAQAADIESALLGWINAAGQIGHDVDQLAGKLYRFYGLKTGRTLIRDLSVRGLIALSDDGKRATITLAGIEALG